MMTRYDIDYKKLALLLTPISLRKPLLMAVMYLFVSPLSRMAKQFDSFRADTNYRLTHNGQVCYLRAVLNDIFDNVDRRIRIEDLDPQKELLVWKRSQNNFVMVPERNAGAVIISKRGFGGHEGFDFVIVCPAALRGSIDEARMRAIVNNYKLTSKRYTITYK